MKRVKDHRYLYRRGEVLWFRRAVPPGARAAFGGVREVQTSLRTSDISKARHLLHRELERFEERLSVATGSATPLEIIALSQRRVPSKAEIEEAVRTWLDERLRRTAVGDYSTPEKVDGARAQLVELKVYSDAVANGLVFGAASPLLTTQWLAESLIERNGWRVEPGSELERHLHRTAGRGQVEVSGWQSQDIMGEPRTIFDATFLPDQYRRDEERRRDREWIGRSIVSFKSLFDGYAAESAPAPATVKAWRRQIEAFVSFLGHEDANAVTLANVVDWKEKLLTQPNAVGKRLSARTVRDTYLSALKTVLRWGCENGKIAANPAAGVRVRGPRETVEREEKGLSDTEAAIILAATLVPLKGRLTVERARAQRWVPWLCAYTGARVNEITQLRATDVKQIDGIWTIRISPEAGSVKNGKARTVPLHPHIVEQGFPAVAASLTGPIFFNAARHRGGSAGNPQSKKVGEHLARWVRKIGVIDPEVQPNHGWRHRFKTQARDVEMQVEVRDAIQGHAPRTEGEGYGNTPLSVAFRAIQCLPRYVVTGQ